MSTPTVSPLPDNEDLSASIARILPRGRGQFHDGRWDESGEQRRQLSINPSTGEPLAEFLAGGVTQVNSAVASASKAAPAWAATPPLERARRLREAALRVRMHARDLALLDAADCGNPVRAMLLDADFAATQLEYFAGLTLETRGETIPTGNGSLNYTLREPLGVVARIFPFNHPFMFGAAKMAAPLAAGNTVVLKPPEQAPLSTLFLMDLLADVFPAGVLNCVAGGKDAGAALASHPQVAAVGLIGSIPAGKAVVRASADTLKRTLLELGGKNAMIVYPDADLDKAVLGAIKGMNFTWCGQSCGSTSRLFLHESLHDRFIELLARRLPELHRPGIATHTGTTMGALVDRAQYERTLGFIESAEHEGATLVTGGRHPSDPQLAKGFFVEPTVFSDVRSSMRIAREEVFGPVLSVFRWSNEDAMFSEVNALEFGLTGAIWTQNLRTAHIAARRVQAGYIWINDTSSHFPGTPFGGYKQSGMGREESHGELLEFTQQKNVNVALL